MSELPKGWEAPGLAEICDFNPKHDPDTDREQLISFVPMPAVSDETGTIETPQERLLSEIWKGYTHFQNGDVIFAKITPCMENGKSAVAGDLTNGLACGSTEFHVLRPRGGVLPDYIWKFVRQVEFRRDAEAHMTGAVGQRRVPKPYLEKHPIPLPPLSEQRRIVGKLDTLGARTNTTRTHLSAIAKLVERYKNSVLEREFFGPNSGAWAQISFLETVNSTQNGLSKRRGDEGKPSKVLRLADLSGNVFLGDAPREIVLAKNEQEKFALTDGDIVIVRVNGSEKIVGRMIVWGDEEGWTYCDHFIRARLTDQFEPAFVRWLFETDKVRAQIEVSFVSSAGQKTINKSILSQILVPDIPRVDQYKIVQRIETAFYKIDLLAAEAEKALKLTDRLDQRILAKAFAGGLVPQDANDEPASVLLDRIRAERASAPKPKRGRKKKADA